MRARLLSLDFHGHFHHRRRGIDVTTIPHYIATVVIEHPTFVIHKDDQVPGYRIIDTKAVERTEEAIRKAVEFMLYNPYAYPLKMAAAFLETLQPPPQDSKGTWTPLFPFPQPNEEDIVPSKLECELCGQQTNASQPGAGWREVKPLYRPAILGISANPDAPQYFCSHQCQVNHIIKTSDQPIVMNPKTLRGET